MIPLSKRFLLPSAFASQNLPITIVGEIHGTNEMPLRCLELIELCLNLRKKLLFHIEIEHTFECKFSEFLTLEKYYLSDFLTIPFWSGSSDGRSSSAWLQIFSAIREFCLQGARLGVSLIRPTTSDVPQSGGGIEEFMATKIIEKYSSNTDSSHIVLVGNLHAQTRCINLASDKMGHIVKAKVPETSSVVFTHQGGDFRARVIVDSNKKDLSDSNTCLGTVSTTSSVIQKTPYGYLGRLPFEEAWDWEWNIGRITASTEAKEM